MVTNDVSARDVQLPKTQFYESKSYPTFTPVGPALVLLDADELKRFTDLRLRLWVNGELRQDGTVGADMIYRPAEALQALARFQRLDRRRPGAHRHAGRHRAVRTAQAGRDPRVAAAARDASGRSSSGARRAIRNTWHDGDVIEATVATDDGAIDLGTQRTVVRYTR